MWCETLIAHTPSFLFDVLLHGAWHVLQAFHFLSLRQSDGFLPASSGPRSLPLSSCACQRSKTVTVICCSNRSPTTCRGVCVCLCVWVFEASLTSQEGLWPVWLLLWWRRTAIRGVLRSFFKYYLFLSLVHLFCFSCLWLEAMIVCHMKWSDFTLKSCNLFWHGIRLLDCWSHSMCAPER